jgi:hypothetical protein
VLVDGFGSVLVDPATGRAVVIAFELRSPTP